VADAAGLRPARIGDPCDGGHRTSHERAARGVGLGESRTLSKSSAWRSRRHVGVVRPDVHRSASDGQVPLAFELQYRHQRATSALNHCLGVRPPGHGLSHL